MSDSRNDLSRFDWPGEEDPRAGGPHGEEPADDLIEEGAEARGPAFRPSGDRVFNSVSLPGRPLPTLPDLDGLFEDEEAQGPAPAREPVPEEVPEPVPEPEEEKPALREQVPYTEQDLTDRSYIPDDIPDDGRNRRQAMMILGGMGALFLALVLILIVRLPSAINSAFGTGGGSGQGESFLSFLTRERPSYGGGVSGLQQEDPDEDEDYDPFDPDYSYLLSRMEYSPLEEVLFPVEIYEPGNSGQETSPYRDSVEDCAARIGGTMFDFPVTWEDLTQAGYEPASPAEGEKILLYPGETSCQTFEKDGKKIRFQICCNSRTAQPLQACLVSGFTAEETDTAFADIVLPCGLSLAEADWDALRKAYGNPDSERKEIKAFLWESGDFGGCLIRLDEENRVTACSYMDFAVPGGYSEPGLPEGLVWEEEKVALPDAPAGDGSDGVFRTSTGTYRALQPLTVLLDDGWEITYDEGSCPAGQTEWIGLENQEEESLFLEVINISPDLLPVRDCRILNLSIYDREAFLGIGPFESGMDWKEACAAAEKIKDSMVEDEDIYITFRQNENDDTDVLFVSGDDGDGVDDIYFYFEATAQAAMDRMRASVRLP